MAGAHVNLAGFDPKRQVINVFDYRPTKLVSETPRYRRSTYALQKRSGHEGTGHVLVVPPVNAGDEDAVLIGRAVLGRLARRRPREDIPLLPRNLDVGAVVGRELAGGRLVERGVSGVARVAVLLEHAPPELGPLVEEGVAREGYVIQRRESRCGSCCGCGCGGDGSCVRMCC